MVKIALEPRSDKTPKREIRQRFEAAMKQLLFEVKIAVGA
jgi:hypothetical protein